MSHLFKSAFILFIFFGNIANAQSINGTPIKDLDIEYLEIKVSVGRDHRVSVSYDEHEEVFVSNLKSNVNSLRDKEGNMIVLPNQISALNFFAKNGFELVESFAIQNPNFHYFILRRKEN